MNSQNKDKMLLQLEKWLDGENYHYFDDELCGVGVAGSICVPDYSCCVEHVKTPIGVKKHFIEAFKNNDDSTVHEMMMMFLQNAIPEAKIASIEDFEKDLDLKECSDMKKFV